MGRIRKRLSAGAKARVALDAVKNEKTLSEIAREHQVHPNQVSEWRKILTGRCDRIHTVKQNDDCLVAE